MGRPRVPSSERYDLDGADAPGGRPTYSALAAELGMSVSDVTIGLFFAFLVALAPAETGEHYYWQIMLPGGILGMIVGYATFTYRGKRLAA